MFFRVKFKYNSLQCMLLNTRSTCTGTSFKHYCTTLQHYSHCTPQVTGIHGLMARSVVEENITVEGGVWHESNSIPGWKWKGDTSSDEVVGHMFAYPIVYDLIAEGDEDMKEDIEDLIDDVVG